MPCVDSVIEIAGAGAASPTVSRYTSATDVVVCTDSCCSDGFLSDASGGFLGGPTFNSGFSVGGVFEACDPDNWVIRRANRVPDPMPLAMFGLALTGLALRRRA